MKIVALILMLIPFSASAQNEEYLPEEWPQYVDLMHYMETTADCFYGSDTRRAAQECIGQGAAHCMADGAYSTYEMMSCLGAESIVWGHIMDDEYRAAQEWAEAMDADGLEFFPEYSTRLIQLREAQEAWIIFWSANCGMKRSAWGEGSMRLLAGASCGMNMIAERSHELFAYYNR